MLLFFRCYDCDYFYFNISFVYFCATSTVWGVCAAIWRLSGDCWDACVMRTWQGGHPLPYLLHLPSPLLHFLYSLHLLLSPIPPFIFFLPLLFHLIYISILSSLSPLYILLPCQTYPAFPFPSIKPFLPISHFLSPSLHFHTIISKHLNTLQIIWILKSIPLRFNNMFLIPSCCMSTFFIPGYFLTWVFFFVITWASHNYLPFLPHNTCVLLVTLHVSSIRSV